MRWDKLAGGIRAKKILSGVLFSRRVANAYLFVGFDPQAKLEYARFFGQSLLCEQKGVCACGECGACKKFIKRVHPDFIFVEPEGAALKIEQIKELKKFLYYGPVQSDYLVVLIDRADAMSIEAANSFLKSLEEPAEGIVFLLLAEREESLPLTITSRCQRIVFEEEMVRDKEVKDILLGLEKTSESDLVYQLDFAQNLLKADPDLRRVILNLLSAYRQKIFLGLENREKLKEGLAKMRLLFDAYRKINLHINKRLMLENISLKWGAAHETFGN